MKMPDMWWVICWSTYLGLCAVTRLLLGNVEWWRFGAVLVLLGIAYTFLDHRDDMQEKTQ